MSTQILAPNSEENIAEVTFSGDAIASLNKSEIAQQIEIARQYPRNLDRFRARLEAMATVSPAIAESMFYSMPRSGGQIIGPGVRFAEAVVTAWGNARAAVRLLGVQGNFFVAQGAFFDCETNVGIAIEAQRRVTDKNGHRFRDDMIGVTGNAAGSIAYRNAILRGVPKALWNDIYEKAKVVAVGEAKSLNAQINDAMQTFRKLGVTDVQVLNTLGIPSLREINTDHLLTLRVLYRDVTGGDKTIEDVFGSPLDEEIERLMEQFGWSETKRRMSRESYKGRRDEHLAYLRAQLPAAPIEKSSPVQKTTPPAQPEATPAEPSQEDAPPEAQAAPVHKAQKAAHTAKPLW